jgi:multidrug efflux pump subunit AcrA (membrane-fusion protein)
MQAQVQAAQAQMQAQVQAAETRAQEAEARARVEADALTAAIGPPAPPVLHRLSNDLAVADMNKRHDDILFVVCC